MNSACLVKQGLKSSSLPEDRQRGFAGEAAWKMCLRVLGRDIQSQEVNLAWCLATAHWLPPLWGGSFQLPQRVVLLLTPDGAFRTASPRPRGEQGKSFPLAAPYANCSHLRSTQPVAATLPLSVSALSKQRWKPSATESCRLGPAFQAVVPTSTPSSEQSIQNFPPQHRIHPDTAVVELVYYWVSFLFNFHDG